MQTLIAWKHEGKGPQGSGLAIAITVANDGALTLTSEGSLVPADVISMAQKLVEIFTSLGMDRHEITEAGLDLLRGELVIPDTLAETLEAITTAPEPEDVARLCERALELIPRGDAPTALRYLEELTVVANLRLQDMVERVGRRFPGDEREPVLRQTVERPAERGGNVSVMGAISEKRSRVEFEARLEETGHQSPEPDRLPGNGPSAAPEPAPAPYAPTDEEPAGPAPPADQDGVYDLGALFAATWKSWPVRSKRERAEKAFHATVQSQADAELFIRVRDAYVSQAQAMNAGPEVYSYTFFRDWRNHLGLTQEPGRPAEAVVAHEEPQAGAALQAPAPAAAPAPLANKAPSFHLTLNENYATNKGHPFRVMKSETVDGRGGLEFVAGFDYFDQAVTSYPDLVVTRKALTWAEERGLMRPAGAAPAEVPVKRKEIELDANLVGSSHPFNVWEITDRPGGDQGRELMGAYQFLELAIRDFPGATVAATVKGWATEHGRYLVPDQAAQPATVEVMGAPAEASDADPCECEHVRGDHLGDGPCIYSSGKHCQGFRLKGAPARAINIQQAPDVRAALVAMAEEATEAPGDGLVIDTWTSSHGQPFGVFDEADHAARPGEPPLRAWPTLASAIADQPTARVTDRARAAAATEAPPPDRKIEWRGAEEDEPFGLYEKRHGRWVLVGGSKYLQTARKAFPGAIATEKAKAEAGVHGLYDAPPV